MRLRSLVLLGLTICSQSVFSACQVNADSRGSRWGGFDPVAFHTENRAVSGTKRFQLEREGATYLFRSKRHLALFRGDPGKYEPAYGGFCAYGVQLGAKFDGSPETWNIVNGRLYLQHSRGSMLVWEKNAESNIAIADKKWSVIENECD